MENGKTNQPRLAAWLIVDIYRTSRTCQTSQTNWTSQTGRSYYAISGGSSVRRLPLDCELDGHRALGVDHDALDEDRDHHELDALALHNPLVSLSVL